MARLAPQAARSTGHPMTPDLHAPCPGQTQTRCDLYIDLLRGIIEHQAKLIADLLRREAGEPVTNAWLDRVQQPGAPQPHGASRLPADLIEAVGGG